MPNSSELTALVAGVIVSVALIGAAFYFLRWMRRRQVENRVGAPPTAEVARDRAHNRLALARREADVLAAQGMEVERARSLIALSDASLRQNQYDRAYELAQSAHETLVALRRRPLSSSTPDGQLSAPAADATSSPLAEGTGNPSPLPSTTPATPLGAEPAVRPPKNRLESQFQLKLFEKELATSPSGPEPGNSGARELWVQAHAAFDRADYTEALRLALRGRRQLGGKVETLGPPLSAGDGRASGPPGPAASVPSTGREAVGVRCGHCGNPIVEGDTFCRACGAPRSALACPNCGVPRLSTDQFCGRCGKRYA